MPVDATLPYDDDNIFAKILRGEIPCDKVHEDEHTLAFRDINPQAPTHILVIPKGRYVSWADFSARAQDAEITGFVRAVGTIARQAGLVETGYRLLANTGGDAHQEVPHLHVHIFAGTNLGPMLAPSHAQ
ncbi:histidine triad nucleotide-binding protein [Stakelama sp. CBK3Z-3]|uniref:Histidine triad nucleotide-binding protein n=1 Tax=Stakelama flava TaxID=2860338 RepID=A0ABS6XMW3_9SPHN|nr:histidine triad nucleotide-binding protein [Stakelama flava]MBW4331540.1 histidine triad nucleotide-binding protein [Stakelama flava]